MQDRALTEKSTLPTEAALEVVLKDAFKYYKSLIKMTEEYDNKWSFYKNWSQKIFDKKKALFYIAPYYGSLIVSMAIREEEREALMMNKMLSYAHDQLKESEKYNEGYALQFIVVEDKSFEECEMFIHELMRERNRK